MTDVRIISCSLETANEPHAGTDGDAFLGVLGREFNLDTSADNRERGSAETYIFGDGANVSNKSINDPTNPQLILENVERFPVYIRFGPHERDDRWKLHRATVTFNGQFFPMWDTLDLIPSGIWLGNLAGLIIYIPKHQDTIP